MAASIDVPTAASARASRGSSSWDLPRGIGGIAIAGNAFTDYDIAADGRRFIMFPRGAAAGEERAGIITVVSSAVRRPVARLAARRV